jgi:hypothetical protein
LRTARTAAASASAAAPNADGRGANRVSARRAPLAPAHARSTARLTAPAPEPPAAIALAPADCLLGDDACLDSPIRLPDLESGVADTMGEVAWSSESKTRALTNGARA